MSAIWGFLADYWVAIVGILATTLIAILMSRAGGLGSTSFMKGLGASPMMREARVEFRIENKGSALPLTLMRLLSAPDRSLDIRVRLKSEGSVELLPAARFLGVMDIAFREHCHREDLPFDGLEVVEIGAGSLWTVLRPKRRAGSKPRPRSDRAGIGSFVVGVAALLVAVEGRLPDARDDLGRTGVTCIEVRGGGQTASCNLPVPTMMCFPAPSQTPPGNRFQQSSIGVIFEVVDQSGTLFAVATQLGENPIPIDDQRTLGEPLFQGRRYFGLGLVVSGQSGAPAVFQLRSSRPYRDEY